MKDKKDYPSEDELVLCIVKEIKKPQVFVEIDKYKKIGVIQFSEIAPGRIRNIREFVVPNKRIVCKVLRVLPDGHIDLSLRRVSAKERESVMKIYKREKDAENLLKAIIKEDKINKIKEEILSKYKNLFTFLIKLNENPGIGKDFDLSEKEIKEIKEEISKRFLEKKVSKVYRLLIKTQDQNGIFLIKELLKNIEKLNAKVRYISAPLYELILEEKDFEEIENKRKKINEILSKTKNFEIVKIEEKD